MISSTISIPISTSNAPSSGSSHKNLPAIICGAVGASTVVIIAVLGLLLIRRRQTTAGVVEIDCDESDDEGYTHHSILPTAFNSYETHNDICTTSESRTLLMSSLADKTSTLVAPVESGGLTSGSTSGYGGMGSSVNGVVGAITTAPRSKISQRQGDIAQQF
jgi:hypothetical protein